MKKLPYSEGSIFLVPLEGGGYARGVVARSAPKGKILLGYFFGPRVEGESDMPFDSLDAADSVLRLLFGDLGLIKNEWPVIGSIPNWDRTKWPMIETIRRDALGRLKPMLVRYADDDPSKVIAEEVLENDRDLPTSGLAGSGFVEVVLSKKLA
jgi:Immunity protein 26